MRATILAKLYELALEATEYTHAEDVVELLNTRNFKEHVTSFTWEEILGVNINDRQTRLNEMARTAFRKALRTRYEQYEAAGCYEE